ncbi:MAG: hypothetical protein GKC10_02950 [Methanosarcinales archaeon]|nr:hypothetical protein [Methanosarcinales archaeon]
MKTLLCLLLASSLLLIAAASGQSADENYSCKSVDLADQASLYFCLPSDLQAVVGPWEIRELDERAGKKIVLALSIEDQTEEIELIFPCQSLNGSLEEARALLEILYPGIRFADPNITSFVDGHQALTGIFNNGSFTAYLPSTDCLAAVFFDPNSTEILQYQMLNSLRITVDPNSTILAGYCQAALPPTAQTVDATVQLKNNSPDDEARVERLAEAREGRLLELEETEERLATVKETGLMELEKTQERLLETSARLGGKIHMLTDWI